MIWRVLSLFDGIATTRYALEKAGVRVEKYYASEVDKFAIKVALKNYPDIVEVGDIRNLNGKEFTDIDLIIGGSPCQDLSIAKRNRRGLNGSRSALFWEYVRLLKEVKPKYFILENVASMPKKDKEIITSTLWGIEPVMINATLVSAQQRKRLFWVGVRDGDRYRKINIPQPEDRKIYLKDILLDGYAERDKSLVITATYSRACPQDYFLHSNRQLTFNKPVRVGTIGKGGQGERIYSIDGKSVALSANGGGRGAKTGLYLITGCAKRTRNGKGKHLEVRKDGKANALTTVQTDSMAILGSYVRKLHPVECERLQGLPDGYTEGISKTQRYKCLGNAFNADVVAHIITHILKEVEK